MAPDSLTTLAGTQLTLQGRARAKRMLDVLRKQLEQEERPLHLATASRGTLVAATDRRLIVIRGQDVQEIAYDRMISFAAGKDGRKAFIQIQADTGEILVKGIRQLRRHLPPHARPHVGREPRAARGARAGRAAPPRRGRRSVN